MQLQVCMHASSESVSQRVTSRESVVLLVPGFPGSENETDCLPPVQNFVRAVARRNPSIAFHVISFQYPFTPGHYRWHGVTVHALAGRNKRFPMRLSSWVRAALRVRALMKSHRVVALHSMWLAECTYVASWMARITGTKHIASIRGQDALRTNPYLRHLHFERMTVTAGSENAAAAFLDCTGRQVDQVLPTGLDVEALSGGRRPVERSIDVLGVGSLSPVKDYVSFLEIVGSLREKHSRLRCMIIGEGAERPHLEAFIRERKLEGVVELTGHLPREEVLRMMQKSRVLLHTARFEGQGYVLLEALASGMRIVCRDVGFAGSGEGTFRCASNEEMVHTLNRLLSSAMEELHVDVLDIDRTAGAFEKLYFS
jgi:glycosyltransferase involved in cell wall biosynthesis